MRVLDEAAARLRAGEPAARFRVTGTSMLPRMRDGELVTVYRIPDKKALKPGDIILAKADDGIIRLHQVLVTDHLNKRAETGDMERRSDGYASYRCIYGIRLTVEQAAAFGCEDSRLAQEDARLSLATSQA